MRRWLRVRGAKGSRQGALGGAGSAAGFCHGGGGRAAGALKVTSDCRIRIRSRIRQLRKVAGPAQFSKSLSPPLLLTNCQGKWGIG